MEKMEAIPKTQFWNKIACKNNDLFPENFSILGSEVPSFALYWGLILGFWISFRYLWKISSILQFVLYSLALLRFLTIQFFCTLWLFDKYKMQDPVQKSVVFPERVKSCNLYRVTGLYSLSILKESKSQRVKSCNPKNVFTPKAKQL